MKVGIKYCGHCNPLVEGHAVMEQLQSLEPSLSFVPWHEPEKDILLIFSGCLTDCVAKPKFVGPVLNVAGNSVERKWFAISELPGAILQALREKQGNKNMST
ncbi:MAG: hypothetical protein ACYCVD_03850 [Desulfitobacteriaceae bacterium]